LQSNADYNEKGKSKAQQPYDSTYHSIERNFSKKKKKINDDLSNSATPAIGGAKGRATATPCRKATEVRNVVFKIEPEAFRQPHTNDSENLIVNLEDIVKEEHIINQIQELFGDDTKLQQLCQRWWELTNNSSVKEMELFFEEDNAKKLIRNQQIILALAIGYIELMEEEILKSTKSISSVKNIIANVHK